MSLRSFHVNLAMIVFFVCPLLFVELLNLLSLRLDMKKSDHGCFAGNFKYA